MAQLRVTPGTGGAQGARALGPVRTVPAAQKVFLTQLGPTDYNSAAWDAAARKDCGPTSALIGLAAIRLVKRPAADEAAGAIAAARKRMHPDGDAVQGTTAEQLQQGVADYGARLDALPLRVERLPARIDAALARGHVVLLEGDPKTVWGQKLDEKGEYLEHYTRRDTDFDHWIAVLGKTAEGLYIVADPLARKGPFAVSANDLVRYLTNTGGEMPAWAGELSPAPVPGGPSRE
jgi:hypothetical protein